MATTELPAQCDVLIVGGGPAGSMCAALLAKNGYDVVMLEREKHPRPTVGENLLPTAWLYLEMLGIADQVQTSFVKKGGALVHWNNRVRSFRFSDFGFQRPAMHIDRDDFDHLLWQTAISKGAKGFEQTRAEHVDFYDGGVRVQTSQANSGPSISARYLVDASGQRGFVARQLNKRDFWPDTRFMAVYGHFTGGQYVDRDFELREPKDVFAHLPLTAVSSTVNWGWAWHIQLKSKTSIGVVLAKDDSKKFQSLGNDLATRLQRIVQSIPMFRPLVDSAILDPQSVTAINDYSFRSDNIIGERCFLIGDAAVFVDPIASNGVPFGLYSGYLAAETIHQSLSKPSAGKTYREMFDRLYYGRQLLFRLASTPDGTTHFSEHDLREVAESLRHLSQNDLNLLQTHVDSVGRPDALIKMCQSVGIQGHCRSFVPTNGPAAIVQPSEVFQWP